MGLHDGHRERIRKRLREVGMNGMQEHEVLEFLLFHTRPRGDVNELAHRLLNEFGTLYGVIHADFEDLTAVKGVGETTALFLTQLPTVFRWCMTDKKQKKFNFNSTDHMAEYMRQNYFNPKREELYALLFDSKMNLLRTELVATGSLRAVHMDYRRLIGLCFHAEAHYVVLAHNHPSAILLPSSSDISTTNSVAETLKKVEVILVDHLIIGIDDYVSMAQSAETAYIFPPMQLPDVLY